MDLHAINLTKGGSSMKGGKNGENGGKIITQDNYVNAKYMHMLLQLATLIYVFILLQDQKRRSTTLEAPRRGPAAADYKVTTSASSSWSTSTSEKHGCSSLTVDLFTPHALAHPHRPQQVILHTDDSTFEPHTCSANSARMTCISMTYTDK
eukprot:6152113-Amphidinium_carterae.2